MLITCCTHPIALHVARAAVSLLQVTIQPTAVAFLWDSLALLQDGTANTSSPLKRRACLPGQHSASIHRVSRPHQPQAASPASHGSSWVPTPAVPCGSRGRGHHCVPGTRQLLATLSLTLHSTPASPAQPCRVRHAWWSAAPALTIWFGAEAWTGWGAQAADIHQNGLCFWVGCHRRAV
jgi:hypothetical protein